MHFHLSDADQLLLYKPNIDYSEGSKVVVVLAADLQTAIQTV